MLCMKRTDGSLVAERMLAVIAVVFGWLPLQVIGNGQREVDFADSTLLVGLTAAMQAQRASARGVVRGHYREQSKVPVNLVGHLTHPGQPENRRMQ